MHLAIASRVIRRIGPKDWRARAFAILILAMLPRDAYTSAFISNDILLEATVGLSIVAYCRYSGSLAHNHFHVLILGIAVIAASLTKQSGLITLVLMAGVLAPLWNTRSPSQNLNVLCIVSMCFVAILAVSIEASQVWHTGKLFVSNQHFFDWTAEQPPGQISEVTFWDLRLFSLFREPWLGVSTLSSLPTEVFARFFFDYEPKLIGPTEEALLGARLGIVSGSALVLMMLHGASIWIRQMGSRTGELPLMALLLLFMAVPIVQTVRFPYFSSMKAVFVLPAISIVMGLISLSAARMLRSTLGRLVLVLTTTSLASSAALGLIAAHESIADVLMQVPAWPFPPL